MKKPKYGICSANPLSGFLHGNRSIPILFPKVGSAKVFPVKYQLLKTFCHLVFRSAIHYNLLN